MNRIFLLAFCVLFVTGCAAQQSGQSLSDSDSLPASQDTSLVSPTSEVQAQPVEFKAQFEILTNGTKRIFTDKRYHSQSSQIYIESSQPNQIIVKKTGATWNDFFQTLPMSLTPNCLVTGTKQIFCSNDTHTLRFWINSVETPDALNREIEPNDFLKVEYSVK